MPRWCLGVSVVSRLRLGGALVVFQWCHRGVSMVSVVSWLCFCVSWRCVCGVLRCLRDVLVSLRQSKLAISLAILISRWWCLCVVLVVSLCCFGGVSVYGACSFDGLSVMPSWHPGGCNPVEF